MASPGLQLGREYFVQRRPEEGEGHAHDGYHEPWGYDPPPKAVYDSTSGIRVAKDLAPGYHGGVAQTEEAYGSFVDNDAWYG